MPNAPAARVTDQVQHSEAHLFRQIGMGLGAIIGIGIGVALVAASGAVEVLSAGTATPIAALGIYVGASLVIGGTAAATGSAVSNSAADVGKRNMENDGPILTGVTTIHIGPEKHVAAHAGSKVACKRHKHNEPDDVELIAQGSSSVFLGPGRDPAARVGDKGTCNFKVGQGCPTVIIGGGTTTRYKIVDGDDPDKALFNKIGEYGGYAALIGGALIAIPVAAAGGSLLMGLRAGAMVLGKGLALSKGIEWAIKKIPNEELRDHIGTAVALILPFADRGGKGKGGGGEGDTTSGGDTSTGSGDTPPAANDNTPPAANDNMPSGDGGNPPSGGDKPPAANDNTPPAANDNAPSGTSDARPSGETVKQIGESEGGAAGNAPPDGSSSPAASTPQGAEAQLPASSEETSPGAGTENPAAENKPAEENKPADEATDPATDQAAKDQAFQDRAAAKAKTVRDGLHEDNQGRNIAVSEYTPEPGSSAEAGAGDYDPSVSGKKSPSYADSAGGPRNNPTQKGTGALADQTHPIKDGGESGNEHPGDRSTDSEVKLIESFQRDLDANPNMRGTLDIYSDPNKPCGSCQDVARWFNSQPEGRGRVRIHSADGGVFDEGGRISDLPPGYVGRETAPVAPGDPTVQVGPHTGGAPGEAAPEEAAGSGGSELPGPARVGEGDPTLQTGENLGGRVNTPEEGSPVSQEDSQASPKESENSQKTTSDDPSSKKYVVSFFNERGAGYKQKDGATLGAPGGSSWVMPLEDAAGINSAADAARETGYAPSVLDAAQKGQDVFALVTPSEGLPLRLPTAADAGGNPNWLPGGQTAIRVADKFFVNPTHEFVTPGEQLVPPGSVLTKILPDGSWAWPPLNVFRDPGVPGPGIVP